MLIPFRLSPAEAGGRFAGKRLERARNAAG